MATTKAVEAVTKKVFCKKLVIMGELDMVQSPSDVSMVAILDYHLYNSDGEFIRNEGIEERMVLEVTLEDLVASESFMDLVGAKIDSSIASEESILE